MAYEVRDMSGTLFPEQEKRSEKGPDWTGTVVVRGETLRIAAWTKEGRRGQFLSLAFSEPRDGGGRRGGSDDDQVPF